MATTAAPPPAPAPRPTARRSARHSRPGRGARLVPYAFLLLAAVPFIAGALRLTQLASGAPETADNARFVESPLPVVVHIIGATLFIGLGAFQFSPDLRRRRPRWHRLTGRVVVPSGVAAALSGLWMTFAYDLPAHDGPLLAGFRVLFGVGMAAALVLGVRAVLRRDITAHRAWMARGYAIGLGAGTQVFTLVPYQLLVGEPGATAKAWLMAAGWGINLAVAELVVRRHQQPWRPADRRGSAPVAAEALGGAAPSE